jgi:DNA-directed RNA polymerase specialized sigma24 family protein
MAGSAQVSERRFAIVNALNDEWDRLVDSRVDTVAAWRGRHPALAGCADLEDVLRAVRRAPDEVLGLLLGEVRAGDALAGRVVLQAMLGKVVRMALRDRRAGVDDYVAALWCRVRTYPLDRRPARIAANLALDALKDVTAERRAVGREVATPWPPGDHLEQLVGRRLAEADTPDLDAGRVLRAAVRLRLLDPRACALLHTVYVQGRASAAAGQQHQMTPELVRYHCSRAVRRLRDHRIELADAA